MKFEIDRSRWRGGGGDVISKRGVGRTFLLNEEGYQCCLGFVCEQSGVDRDSLFRVPLPYLLNTSKGVENLLVEKRGEEYTDTILCGTAIMINDSESYTPEEREARLAHLFRSHGHELEFTGEYAS